MDQLKFGPPGYSHRDKGAQRGARTKCSLSNAVCSSLATSHSCHSTSLPPINYSFLSWHLLNPVHNDHLWSWVTIISSYHPRCDNECGCKKNMLSYRDRWRRVPMERDCWWPLNLCLLCLRWCSKINELIMFTCMRPSPPSLYLCMEAAYCTYLPWALHGLLREKMCRQKNCFCMLV